MRASVNLRAIGARLLCPAADEGVVGVMFLLLNIIFIVKEVVKIIIYLLRTVAFRLITGQGTPKTKYCTLLKS